MKKILIKIITFFIKDHIAKYVTEVLLFLALLISLSYLAANEVISNVMGVVVGFLISTMLLYIFRIIGGFFEDMLKINYDTNELLKIYSGNPDYRKSLEAQGTKVEFAYADILTNQNYQFKVVDSPTKTLQLDSFIEGNYAQIFSAHSNSVKRNFDTIRLDKFDPETKTFYLSRSTYFNHLVTNRAVDFDIFENVSLRTIFEYGPRLSSLEDSKMSNHIGINALVFLSDGRLLIPRRKTSSTISKNKVTSSIAVMLNFPDEAKNDPKHATISAEYLLHGNILKNLSDRVKLPKNTVKESEVEIEFLGFGQNIYEGGKPQFYYAVKLKNIDTATYFAQRKVYLAEQKKAGIRDLIDVDKCMYIADYSTFRYVDNFITFTAYTPNGTPRKIRVGYEMSYLCNLWHYEKTNLSFAPKNSSAR